MTKGEISHFEPQWFLSLSGTDQSAGGKGLNLLKFQIEETFDGFNLVEKVQEMWNCLFEWSLLFTLLCSLPCTYTSTACHLMTHCQTT